MAPETLLLDQPGSGSRYMRSKPLNTFILAILCTISLEVVAYPRQATQPARTGRLIEVKVPAPSLKGNLLGDPVEQSIAVYLPPSYDTAPTKRYPTLYLL